VPGRRDDLVELTLECHLLAERRGAALERERAHADLPAVAGLAHHVVGRGAASSKNTSLNSEVPVIWRIGRISMPGCPCGTSR
jgi:hypothetical protein